MNIPIYIYKSLANKIYLIETNYELEVTKSSSNWDNYIFNIENDMVVNKSTNNNILIAFTEIIQDFVSEYNKYDKFKNIQNAKKTFLKESFWSIEDIDELITYNTQILTSTEKNNQVEIKIYKSMAKKTDHIENYPIQYIEQKKFKFGDIIDYLVFHKEKNEDILVKKYENEDYFIPNNIYDNDKKISQYKLIYRGKINEKYCIYFDKIVERNSVDNKYIFIYKDNYNITVTFEGNYLEKSDIWAKNDNKKPHIRHNFADNFIQKKFKYGYIKKKKGLKKDKEEIIYRIEAEPYITYNNEKYIVYNKLDGSKMSEEFIIDQYGSLAHFFTKLEEDKLNEIDIYKLKIPDKANVKDELWNNRTKIKNIK